MNFIWILLLLSLNAQASADLVVPKNQPPPEWEFWKFKPQVAHSVREDRRILVSVRREDLPNHQVGFTMLGVGSVNRDKDFCFLVSQNYSRLPEVSDHFKSVHFTPENGQLEVVIEVLKFQAKMTLQITPVQSDWRSELQWKVISGSLQGMSGLVGYESFSDTKTELSFRAVDQAETWPLPKFLMGFALEVVVERVAQKMRAFIEAQARITAPPKAPATPASTGELRESN